MDENSSPKESEVLALQQRGYIIGKKIGKGSYATVHRASRIDRNSLKNTLLACKIFDKSKAPKDFLKKFFPREIEILTKIDNPNIIQIYNILQIDERVYIFMRYAENGDLLEYIRKHGAISENQSRSWFSQIVNGLNYLHSNDIAHRDLKCENILLSKNFHAKLADFGFARFCTDSKNKRVLSKTFCGSAAYAAPEVVSGTPYNPKLADVWSSGIILFIMVNASMPFDDSNLKKLLKNQLAKTWTYNTKVKDILSNGVKSLINNILEPDITIRYNLDCVMNHEWFKGKQLSININTPMGQVQFHPGKKQVPSTETKLPGPSGGSRVK